MPEVTRNWTGSVDSSRLFHGRGRTFDGLEFISIDWFDPLVLVTLYEEMVDDWLQVLVSQLRQALGPRCRAVLVQERYRRDGPTRCLFGDVPDELWAVEDGLRFHLRLGQAQNIGFFLDMREGRSMVRERATGRRTLNLFSYTCAFSVSALAGGASEVVNIDMNRGALATGRDNHRLNGIDLRSVSFLAHDIFKSFGKLRRLGPFDLVVIDPPTAQGESFQAERGWPKVVSRLTSLLAPRGEVLACLNAPHLDQAFLERIFADDLPEARLSARLGAPATFAEINRDAGLKILHYVT